MITLTNEQAYLIEEIFAGYRLKFITAEEALKDLAEVLDEYCWGSLGCPQGAPPSLGIALRYEE